MAEYIDRDAVYTAFANACTDVLERASKIYYIASFSYEHVIEILENIPAADVAPVVHGRWVSVPHKLARVCSVCNRDEPYKFADIDVDVYDYCPNCGAKMDEEVSE